MYCSLFPVDDESVEADEQGGVEHATDLCAVCEAD